MKRSAQLALLHVFQKRRAVLLPLQILRRIGATRAQGFDVIDDVPGTAPREKSGGRACGVTSECQSCGRAPLRGIGKFRQKQGGQKQDGEQKVFHGIPCVEGEQRRRHFSRRGAAARTYRAVGNLV